MSAEASEPAAGEAAAEEGTADETLAGEAVATTQVPAYAEALAALEASGEATPGAALDAFLAVMQRRGTELYPAQEEALLELAAGKHVILATPTGSGKSLVAEFHHFLSMSAGRKSYYTCPIKALVSEKFFNLCRAFGADNVGMLTGDASINRDAPIICCTAEILANVSVGNDAANVRDVIMDEFHYYGDAARGTAWQLPLLALPNATFLLMSATLGDVRTIIEGLRRDTRRETAHVVSHDRPVPLDFSWREVPLTETLAELVREQRVPVYVVHFSQREAIEAAQSATSTDFLRKEEKALLNRELGGFRFDTPFGKTMRRFVGHGIGVHHAGLLPKYRLLVEKLAQAGLLRVIMGTDTLGVGINVPIRSVLFTKLCKFDGDRVGILAVRDFRQIAGRAGRKGYDAAGSVLAQAPEHVIENRRMASRVEGDAKKLRKLVKKKPPAKGFVPWDEKTFARLQTDPPEPLVPRFALSQHLMLTVLQHNARGYRTLIDLIGRSHNRGREKSVLRRRARALFKTLRQADILTIRPAVHSEWSRRPRVVVNAALGEDFSLTHALTLFLLDTLPLLDESQEDYPLAILSVVESILDNPDAVLRRVTDRCKTEAMNALRAQGLDYEERIAELEKVSYPKPMAELLYPTFNDWTLRHPWAAEAVLRPKGIARELVENASTFAQYVRDYGLERAEGVLLRYLSQVLRTLTTNLPGRLVEDTMLDVVTFLRNMLGTVDGSLLEAWTALTDPTDAPSPAAAPVRAPLSLHTLWKRRPQVVLARIRAQVHSLLSACGRHEYAEACRLLVAVGDTELVPGAGRQAQPGAADAMDELAGSEATAQTDLAAAERTAEAVLTKSFTALFAEHPRLDFDPHARRPQFTLVRKLSDDRLQVSQTLLVDGEPTLWALTCEVELTHGPLEEGPLLRFVELAG